MDPRRHRAVGQAHVPFVQASGNSCKEEEISRRRLAVLLQRLAAWLDDPLRIERDAAGHTVWILGAFGYRVDRRRRAVYPVVRDDEDGLVRRGNFTVELLHPLKTPCFLPFIIKHLGLSDGRRQQHLFRSILLTLAEERWMVREAYRLLGRDARFRDLRVRRLPAALGLDRVLCSITLASRHTFLSRIASDRYTFVWRHARSLRAVARENPALLPLAVAALEERRILPYGDTVRELHLLCRESGLAPATWRYLATHGARFLRPAWIRTQFGDRTDAAIGLLREIERAGHPAPPPAWAIGAWISFGAGLGTSLEPDWNPVPPEVVRICFAEARRVRGTRAEVVLREDMRVVFAWAAREKPQLDKLQRRAGWRWLLRQAIAGERRYLLLSTEGSKEWRSSLDTYAHGDYRAAAIVSVDRMVDEGIAFHNCLGTQSRLCQAGWNRYFVVRSARTGERIAVVEISWLSRQECWALSEVKGVANAKVPFPLLEFAILLAGAYASCDAGPVPLPPDTLSDLLEDEPDSHMAPARHCGAEDRLDRAGGGWRRGGDGGEG